MSLKGDFALGNTAKPLAMGVQEFAKLLPEGKALARGFENTISEGQNDSIDRELINKTVREWVDTEKNKESFMKRDHVAEASLVAMKKENLRD